MPVKEFSPPVSEESTMYTLHSASKAHIIKLGIEAYNDLHDSSPDSSPSLVREDSQSCSSSGIDDDFYEVEEVLYRYLSKDTLCYEKKFNLRLTDQIKTCGCHLCTSTEHFNLNRLPILGENANTTWTQRMCRKTKTRRQSVPGIASLK